MREAWTIPFNNVNYICWRDGSKPQYRQMTDEEDYKYFTSANREEYLNELLRK